MYKRQRYLGQIVVEDMGQLFDVQPPGGDVSGHQGLEFPVAGTPMPGWSDYSDFDKYVQNPQRFIVKMKKRQQ